MSQETRISSSQAVGLDKGTIIDPYPRYDYLRATDPVHWNEGLRAWLLTRYADVASALRDPSLSADRMGALMGQLPEAAREKVRPLFRIFSGMMLMSDPPDHTRLRALSNKAFTPRVVERMRGDVQAVVDGLLDEVEQKRGMDVIRDLAFPLPSTVIAEMLGIRPEDRDQFKKWSADITSFLGNVRVVAETVGAAQKSSLELSEYLKEVITQLRDDPKENLLSALVGVEEHGDTFSEEELYSMCILLIFTGHETTTNLIGNGMLALLQNPDQMQKLKDDPSLIVSAVEELLRYDSPIQTTSRIALEDSEIGGKQIRRGENVSPILGAANRDPEQFSDPNRLDITRKQNRQIAFGLGLHFCLGAALARLEGQIVISTALRRMPKLQLGTEELQWRENPIFRGLKSLPISF